MVTLPLCLLALRDSRAAWIYYVLQCTATLSLFPLLFTPMENVLKPFLWVASMAGTYSVLQHLHGWDKETTDGGTNNQTRSFYETFVHAVELCYLIGLVVVYAYYAVLHGYLFGGKLEFLPLLAVSLYCAFGVIYCWLKFVVFSLF
jgi:alpha-1,3-glucosyltransferase